MSPRSHASRVAANEVPNNRAVRKVDAQWRRSHRNADPSHDFVEANPWPRRTPHRSTRCTATDTAADIESIEPTSEAIRSGTATSAHSSKPPAAVSSAINAAVAAAVATASASWVRRVTRPSYMCLIMAQATDSCKSRNPNGDNYFRVLRGWRKACAIWVDSSLLDGFAASPLRAKQRPASSGMWTPSTRSG